MARKCSVDELHLQEFSNIISAQRMKGSLTERFQASFSSCNVGRYSWVLTDKAK